MFRTTSLSSFILATIVVGVSPAVGQGQAAAFSRPNHTTRGELSAGLRPLFAIQTGQSVARPRVSRGLVAGQVILGALGAAVGGMIAFQAFDNPYGPDRKVKGDWGYTPNANTAYALGSFVGSTAAVYLVGRADGSKGSLASTAVGTGVVTLPLLFGRDEAVLPILGIVFGAPLQGILGTVAYQATRK